jgi:stage V sporulation protein B
MIVYNNSIVGTMLKTMTFICPFMYLNMVISSMLNALGEQIASFKINIIESILKISIIYYFVPIYGFNAYLFALFITTAINTLMYLFKLLQISCIVFDISNWIFKPLFAAILASFIARYVFKLFLSINNSIITVLISSIIILSLSYLIFLIIFKSVNTISIKNIKQNIKKVH